MNIKSKIKKYNGKFHPLVSIVIPVYNGSNYVREAIDSALAQTYDNIEIIVVNDGSTDNTEEIVKSYGNKLRYYSKKNGGTSTALNLGIKNMNGSYFSWLSHDDMYYPNKIERQIEELNRLSDKNTIIMSDLDGINENYEKTYITNYLSRINEYPLREKSYIFPILYNQTHGCTLLIPKVCFKVVGIFDENALVAQDFEFFYRAFSKFPHKLVSKILVTARDSSNRQGRRCNNGRILEYSNLFIKIIKKLSDSDIKLLAPNKLNFYLDMKNFFECAGYIKALKYIESKYISNLQISSYDLIGNKFNGYDLHNYLRHIGIDSKMLVLEKMSKDINTFSYDFFVKDAIKNLLQEKIFLDSNIIHLHLVHNILDLNYLPILSKLKPVILSQHDPFFLGGHCVHHCDCKKWQSHCKDCSYLSEEFSIKNDYSALNFELKKHAIQNSNLSTIVASKWMKNKVEKSPIWKDKTVYLLPIGVNQDIFRPMDENQAKKIFGIDENSIVLMFRTGPGSFKGLDIIKKALREIYCSKPIVLIAVGQKGTLGEFRKNFRIIEYDWITDDKFLSSLYQACDVFLMPSRQETFGMMAVEAMSCGKTVLSLDCNGSSLSEVINSPFCGLAVKENNYGNRLQELLNSKYELKERGYKSFVYAKRKYSKDMYIKKLVQIYKKTIKNFRSSNESKLVLEQLKKYVLSSSESNVKGDINGSLSENKSILYKLLPYHVKRRIKDLILLTFYKIDKVFPKSFRKRLKIKLVKINFVRKYLIKNE